MLKLVAMSDQPWTYAGLAEQLGMSVSQLHSAIQRALTAGLAVRRNDAIIPNRPALRDFILHGLKYLFVPERGEVTRGMPTAHAAPPLDANFPDSGEPPPVWPDPEGSVRGMAFAPLTSWHRALLARTRRCMSCWFWSMQSGAEERASARLPQRNWDCGWKATIEER